MARSVNWAQAPKPAADPCGVLAAFYWCGAYEAACVRPRGHAHKHGDGVAESDVMVHIGASGARWYSTGGEHWCASPQAARLASEHVDDQAARLDDEMFGPADAEPEWATPGFDPAARS